MALKNCLKVSYKGLTRTIICDYNLRYADIITKIMETFDLKHIHHSAIEIYDEQGSKFDKDILEYFVLLFPNPQKLFFIRLDSTKLLIQMPPTAYNDANSSIRQAFTVSKSMNQIKDRSVDTSSIEAVPVRRMNCFIGQLPSDNLEPRDHQVVQRHNQRDIIRNIVKKMKLFQENHMKRKTVVAPTIVKRSMRL